MVDPQKLKVLIEAYYANVTDEQFEADLRAWCPEFFDDRFFTELRGSRPSHPDDHLQQTATQPALSQE
jgi:hypothetical protein